MVEKSNERKKGKEDKKTIKREKKKTRRE